MGDVPLHERLRVYEDQGQMCRSVKGSALKLLQTTRLLRRVSSMWRENTFSEISSKGDFDKKVNPKSVTPLEPSLILRSMLGQSGTGLQRSHSPHS
jgi:hypothetical protein